MAPGFSLHASNHWTSAVILRTCQCVQRTARTTLSRQAQLPRPSPSRRMYATCANLRPPYPPRRVEASLLPLIRVQRTPSSCKHAASERQARTRTLRPIQQVEPSSGSSRTEHDESHTMAVDNDSSEVSRRARAASDARRRLFYTAGLKAAASSTRRCQRVLQLTSPNFGF